MRGWHPGFFLETGQEQSNRQLFAVDETFSQTKSTFDLLKGRRYDDKVGILVLLEHIAHGELLLGFENVGVGFLHEKQNDDAR